MENEEITKLEELSKEAKKIIVKISAEAKAAHTGSCLSLIDILVSLYFDIFENELVPQKFRTDAHPRIILSKGHAVASLYAVLYMKGYITREQLLTYHKNSGLPGHADTSVNGVEFSTGSLGHGLAIGTGMALAHKINKKSIPVIVLMGDGECQEGAVWEAANFAAAHILNNLIVIVDHNQFQAYDKTIEVAPTSLEGKWKAFGWNVIEADGHNFSSLHEKISEALHSSKPTAIIAHTIKGKGLKNLENKLESHYISPSGNEFGE